MPRNRVRSAAAVAPLHVRSTRNSSRTLRSADSGPLRRSARLAALQERRRESEENALRQQRERIAQTHRHVSRNNTQSIFASLGLLTPATPSTASRQRTSTDLHQARTSAPSVSANNEHPENPRFLRQFAIRRRGGVMANPQVLFNEVDVHRSVSIANLLQLTHRSTNTTFTGRIQTARMSTGGMTPRNTFHHRRTHGNGILQNADRGSLFFVDNAELRDSVFNIGLLLGNRYSSDSEDSYFQPRVIDPDAISEDESDEEVVPMRELTPPTAIAPPVPPPLNHRPVTRSMSSHPNFYDDPSSSVPRPIIKKKSTKSGVCKCKAGSSTKVKTFIKVEKLTPCTICYEDEPKKPVACTYCRQSVGCRYCVKKWFFTTNMSHLDQRTPYPVTGTDRNHKRCPLCRADLLYPDTLVEIRVSEKA